MKTSIINARSSPCATTGTKNLEKLPKNSPQCVWFSFGHNGHGRWLCKVTRCYGIDIQELDCTSKLLCKKTHTFRSKQEFVYVFFVPRMDPLSCLTVATWPVPPCSSPSLGTHASLCLITTTHQRRRYLAYLAFYTKSVSMGEGRNVVRGLARA